MAGSLANGPGAASVAALDIARGRYPGVATFQRFGHNPAVPNTAFEPIWSNSGAYAWPTAADSFRIAAGGNAADTAAGAGARSVVVQYLDADWKIQTETLVTAGASASASSSGTAIRFIRAWVGASGTYTGGP